jgi:hypothetical protein
MPWINPKLNSIELSVNKFIPKSGKTPQNLHASQPVLFHSAIPLHLLFPYPYLLQCFIFYAVLSTP